MLLETAILIIMIVQLTHLSWHWLRLTGAMLTDRDHRTRTEALDWSRPAARGPAGRTNPIVRFFSR